MERSETKNIIYLSYYILRLRLRKTKGDFASKKTEGYSSQKGNSSLKIISSYSDSSALAAAQAVTSSFEDQEKERAGGELEREAGALTSIGESKYSTLGEKKLHSCGCQSTRTSIV